MGPDAVGAEAKLQPAQRHPLVPDRVRHHGEHDHQQDDDPHHDEDPVPDLVGVDATRVGAPVSAVCLERQRAESRHLGPPRRPKRPGFVQRVMDARAPGARPAAAPRARAGRRAPRTPAPPGPLRAAVGRCRRTPEACCRGGRPAPGGCPGLTQGRFDRQDRAEPLHVALEVGQAALRLREARDGQHDVRRLMLRTGQVVQRDHEVDRGGDGRDRRSDGEQCLRARQLARLGAQAQRQRRPLVGAAVERHNARPGGPRQLFHRARDGSRVVGSSQVPVQDRDRAGALAEPPVSGERPHCRGRALRPGADVVEPVAARAIQVQLVGVHQDQVREAFGRRLLYPQVQDRQLALGVAGDDYDGLRSVQIPDAKRAAVGRRELGTSLERHPGATQGARQQPFDQKQLLVGGLAAQGDADALATESRGRGRQRLLPGRRPALDGRNLQTVLVVDVRVLEPSAIADPAVVDVVVLMRGDPDQLPAPLPHRHVAADRAPGAHRLRVVHVPGAGLEAPHARGESADGAEVDDVPADRRLQRLVELAGDEGADAPLVDRQLLLPGDLVVVAGAPVAEHAALPVEGDPLRERDRLLEMESRRVDLAHRVRMPERVVLERALPALVAHRAVEGVVGELHLQHVGAGGDRHGAVRQHVHTRRHRGGASSLRSRRTGRDLDHAHAAGADRVHLVVVAEDRDLDPQALRRLDHQRAPRHRHRPAVDGQGDVLRPRVRHSPGPPCCGGSWPAT